MKYFAIALLSLALSSIAISANAANKVSRSIPVDKDFQDANIRWNGATAGGYRAKIAFKNNKGRLELCGIGAVTNIQLSPAVRSGLRGGKLSINGKLVLKNFSFFAKAKNEAGVVMGKANCALTTHKLNKKIKDVDFRYGNATFRN